MVYGPPAGFVRNKPSVYIDRDYCIGCMKCVKTCEHDAVHVDGNLASVDYDKCIGCGACAQACPTGALHELVAAAAAKAC